MLMPARPPIEKVDLKAKLEEFVLPWLPLRGASSCSTKSMLSVILTEKFCVVCGR